jgi:phosphoesterase RecJ-like protein
VKNAKKLLQQSKSAKHIVIITHTDPDGDAVGSAILLREFLKPKTKAKITICYDPNAKEVIRGIGQKNRCTTAMPKRYDLLIAVDASTPDRLFPKVPSVDWNIDHHRDNSFFGKNNLVDPQAASVGIIVYRLIQATKTPLSKPAAYGLYLSVSSDTGNFSFSNTTQEVFGAAQAAVAQGITPYSIFTLQNEQLSLTDIKDFGKALQTAETFAHGKGILATIEHDSTLDNRVLIDFLRREKNCRVAVVLVDKSAEGYIKLSFRSKDKTDVSAIAAHFNGGGHRNAAAGKILNTTLAEAKRKIIDYCESHI